MTPYPVALSEALRAIALRATKKRSLAALRRTESRTQDIHCEMKEINR